MKAVIRRTGAFVLLIWICMCCQTNELLAQDFVEKITNWFEFELDSKKHRSDSTYISKIVLAPIVNYEPSTSLGMGLGGKLLFKPKGAGSETRTSNIPASIVYTLNNQFIFLFQLHDFFPEEKFLVKGNLEFSKFPLSYYGVGSQTVEEDKIEISFNNFLFEPLLLRKIRPNLFVGGGIRYNVNYRTTLEEETPNLIEGSSLQDVLGSRSIGAEFAITYDSRDNVLNAFHGNFLEFTHGIYETNLGSTHDFMLSKMNFRQYFKLHPDKLNSVALGWYARYAWNDAPALELSELGGPELLRGFQEGRFRDRLAIFAQAEYRWQALDRIGFVFFAGTGDVAHTLNGFRFDQLKYSLGTGLRIKIVKSENLNIRLDYGFGFGPENNNNFYLGIAEAF